MFARIIGGVLLAALGLTSAFVPTLSQDSPKRRVTVVFDHALPNVPGKSMKGVLVEYGPGGSSRSHRHPASAFIYATVLEGAIRSQVNDGPEKVYRAARTGSSSLATTIASARMPATPNPRDSWPCSWSVPARQTSSSTTRSN